MEFSLLGAVAIAVVCARLTIWFESRGPSVGSEVAAAWEALIVAGIVGLGVGRVASMLTAGVNPVAHPMDLLIVRGGVDTVAATIGAVSALLVIGRRGLLSLADAVAPAAVAGLAGWHGGCVVRGACLGTASDLPWAISGPTGVSRHPVELYAAALLVIGAALLVLAWRRGAPSGVIAGMGLATAGGVRWATEPLRLGIGAGPAWWYAAGAVTGFALAAAGAIVARRTAPNGG